jgi:hypothetical protein
MAYAMTEENTLIDTNWVYHEEPRKVEYASGLLIIIAAAVLVFMHNRQNLHSAFICQLTVTVLVMVAVALSITMRSTIIEINRREGAVTKTNRLLMFRRSRSYPLHDFNTIRLVEQVKTIEEGYLDIFYTIVLQGHGRSFELLSLDDSKKGAQLCKEIISFFALSGYEIVLQEVKPNDKIKRDSY